MEVTFNQIVQLVSRIEELIAEDFVHFRLFGDGGGSVVYPVFEKGGIGGVQEVIEFDSFDELQAIYKLGDYELVTMMMEAYPELDLTHRGIACMGYGGSWDHDGEEELFI